MSPRFSLVYPTRHRPAFVRQALRFLESQEFSDFEVIVSDNWVNPALSCEKECRSAALTNLKYVHPPQPLGMVENWSYPLQFASGEYICYFTDKMFLLPHTLRSANDCIEKSGVEIVSWTDNSYTPKSFPDYFGEGLYEIAASGARSEHILYDPREELSKKGRAVVSRNEQDKSSYARGKICFGAYAAPLCERIVKKAGALFHKISPDYTSMILGLSMASSAAEINQPGIVHVNTDLSNGGQSAIHDELALAYLRELGDAEKTSSRFLVPGLYASIHNVVTHDYLALRDDFDLDFEFDRVNWLVYIAEDLNDSQRIWSSKEVEVRQQGLFRNFIEGLSPHERRAYQKRLAEREDKHRVRLRKRSLRRKLRSIIPEPVIRSALNVARRFPQGSSLPMYCATIEDTLKLSDSRKRDGHRNG